MKKLFMLLLMISVLTVGGSAVAATGLETLGETLFLAPTPSDTSISDKPVADYWEGWTTDNAYGTANYKYYAQVDDYVVQFYRDGKSTQLATDYSFFPNAQRNAGLAKLKTPSKGYGAEADFIVLDFRLKVGNENTCYHDYYFNDVSGKGDCCGILRQG